MINLDSGRIEDLEERLMPVLKRRGIQAESIQLIGLLGRGASSSVFSVMIDQKYYVLKLYYFHSSFLREMRNRRRLIWPPNILLTSKLNENSLGYDMVITEVPEGISFNSSHLIDWVQDLMELHRLKRKRIVGVSGLISGLATDLPAAIDTAAQLGAEEAVIVESVGQEMNTFLKNNKNIMRVQGSLLHNDLWWDNIIIARDDIYLIDWESMRVGDYADDLAYMRIMLDFAPLYDKSRRFWLSERNETAANRFFAGVVREYIHEFNDTTLETRLKYYMGSRILSRLAIMSRDPSQFDHELASIWTDLLSTVWTQGLEDEFI
jgi:hypothetical protein